MSRRSRTLVTVVLGAALVVLIEHNMRDTPPSRTGDLPAADTANIAIARPDELQQIEAFDPPPIHQFAEFVDRPPFSRSRRPPIPEAVVEDAPPEPTPAVAPAFTAKLLGVRIQTQNRAALFHGSNQASARWVTEGEKIDGWTVFEIDGNGVFLRNADQRYELRLWPQ